MSVPPLQAERLVQLVLPPVATQHSCDRGSHTEACAARDPASVVRGLVRCVLTLVALANERAEVRARSDAKGEAGARQRAKRSPRAHHVVWLSGTHGVYL